MSAEELPDLPDAAIVGDRSAVDTGPRQLTPVAVSRDGTRLTLVDADGNEFTVTLGAQAAHTQAPHPEVATARRSEKPMNTPSLRPKDIQARIRAGESPEAVAEAAGTTVERIMPFAGPVIGEREHMAERAQKASVRRPAGAPGTPRALGDAVAALLRTVELEPDAVTWDSWRRHDGRWTVVGVYETAVRSGTAQLTFDPPGNFVSLDNDDARWLVGELVVEAPEPVRDDLAQARERRLSPAPDPMAADEPLEMFLEPTVDPAAEPTVEVAQPDPVAAEPAAEPVAEPVAEAPEPPARRTPAKKRGRASVPSWDEIMFGGGSGDGA